MIRLRVSSSRHFAIAAPVYLCAACRVISLLFVGYVMDVCHLDFPDDYFDIILDKCCLDCLHCHDEEDTDQSMPIDNNTNNNDSNVNHDPITGIVNKTDHVRRAVAECERVLRTNGTLLSVSHSPPYDRIHHFIVNETEYLQRIIDKEKKDREKEKAQKKSILGQIKLGRKSSLKRTSSIENKHDNINNTINTFIGFSRPIVHRLSKLSDDGKYLHTVKTPDITLESDISESSLLTGTDDLAHYSESDHYLYIVTKSMQRPALPSERILTERPTIRRTSSLSQPAAA